MPEKRVQVWPHLPGEHGHAPQGGSLKASPDGGAGISKVKQSWSFLGRGVSCAKGLRWGRSHVGKGGGAWTESGKDSSHGASSPR